MQEYVKQVTVQEANTRCYHYYVMAKNSLELCDEIREQNKRLIIQNRRLNEQLHNITMQKYAK